MSDAQAFGFGQFIPGYDFFQQLSQSSKGAALPPFSSWVAPTVSVEEIDKRIEELKAVQFWLDQNGKALAATVQALQVQKMTLSTLKGMNVNLQEFAQAVGAAQSGDLSNWPMGTAQKAAAAQRQASATALSVSAAAPGGDADGAVEMVGVVGRSQVFPERRVFGWSSRLAGGIIGSSQPIDQLVLAAADQVAQLRCQMAGRRHCQTPGGRQGKAQASMGELCHHGFYGQCGHQKISTSFNWFARAVSSAS